MKRIFTHPVRTKKYQAPKLKKYGKVKNLTMSGSKNEVETDAEEPGSLF